MRIAPWFLLVGAAHAQPLERLPELPDLEPADGVVAVDLTAKDDGAGLFRYSYGGPPPVIRAKQGDMLVVELENSLAEIEEILTARGMGDACRGLVAAAKRNGAHDNVTVVVVQQDDWRPNGQRDGGASPRG